MALSSLQLEHGINFRELGGLPGKEGRLVQPGRLFRAGALSDLSDNDLALLANKLPAVKILDYRDERESTLREDRLWPGAHYTLIPANPLSAQVTATLDTLVGEALNDFDAQAFMLELYRQLPFNNPAYHYLVTVLRDSSTHAIIQHCAVGKDRTGIGSALVLFALGASKETVIQDYLLTQQTLAPFRQQMLSRFASQLDIHGVEKLKYVLSVHIECLQAALDAIDERYGTIERWLAEDYALDASACHDIQQRYLQP